MPIMLFDNASEEMWFDFFAIIKACSAIFLDFSGSVNLYSKAIFAISEALVVSAVDLFNKFCKLSILDVWENKLLLLLINRIENITSSFFIL